MGKPQESQQQQEQEQLRPRTLAQARAQQENRLPGQQMKQEGGVRRRLDFSSLDSKRTPFGDYDRAFIDAVTQYWYGLLDSRQFASRPDWKGYIAISPRLQRNITDMKVLENTVGEVLSLVCQKSVQEPAPYGKCRVICGGWWARIIAKSHSRFITIEVEPRIAVKD